MASLLELELNIEDIQLELARSKRLSELDGEERKQLEDAIYPTISGFRVMKGIGVNYGAFEEGDKLMTIDSVGKKQIVGEVISVPFNPATDLQNTAKFDLYKYDGPAF